MPDEDMVDFYVLANEVDGFNNNTIHTFLHSVHWVAYFLHGLLLNLQA